MGIEPMTARLRAERSTKLSLGGCDENWRTSARMVKAQRTLYLMKVI